MKRNTKELILHESLKLFASRGYDGVTVRDIAQQLGIRQSSLYKHYKNKEDIFQSIIRRMDQDYSNRMEELGLPEGDFSQLARIYGQTSIDNMKHFGQAILSYWIENEYACAFRRMMMLEQYRSKELSQMYQHYLADGVIQYMTALFTEMIGQGYFREEDPHQMAVQFYGPIFLAMVIYDGNEDKEGALKMVADHIEQFAKHYGCRRGGELWI